MKMHPGAPSSRLRTRSQRSLEASGGRSLAPCGGNESPSSPTRTASMNLDAATGSEPLLPMGFLSGSSQQGNSPGTPPIASHSEYTSLDTFPSWSPAMLGYPDV